MNNNDYLSLTGSALRTFLVVLDEKSVSKAAERLCVSQSAVSHSLDKLRNTFDDPLFVRSGRTIDATQKAVLLEEPIKVALDSLKALTNLNEFDPNNGVNKFVVAANDFQRNLIFPPFLKSVTAAGVSTRLKFIPSGLPSASLLRQTKCDLIITPFPPEGADLYQKKLFDDKLVCYFDANERNAPKDWGEFTQCDFVEAQFADQQSSLFNVIQRDTSDLPKPMVSVPNFEAIEKFILGTKMVTVAASLMKKPIFQNLEFRPLPFESDTLSMYLVWHKRSHNDPAHIWLREQLQTVVAQQISDN